MANRSSTVPCYCKKFLSSLESKSLIRIAETIHPEFWQLSEEELAEKFYISSALKELKERFWLEASVAWISGQRLHANKTFSSEHRSYNYWLKVFRNEPAILVWLLKPLEELFHHRSLIYGITNRLYQILQHPFRRRTGTIKVSDANLMFRASELFILFDSEFRKR